MNNSDNEYLRERKCALCGKKFVTYPQHVFKATDGRGRMKYYCKWTCYNHRNDIKGVKNERTNQTNTE